ISQKKGEPAFLLEWRLKAYRHWLTMSEPKWANITYGPIDYQAIHYYAAPKQEKSPESLSDVDPKLLDTFERLGIPLAEQKRPTCRRACAARLSSRPISASTQNRRDSSSEH